MKKILLLLALFPFLHATSYHGELISCKSEEIILKLQGEEVPVALFNIKMKDEAGWNKTCDLLSSAKKITIEIDPSSAITSPLPVYLFADETLVQEELIKQQEAYIQIRNPEYTYEKQMEDVEKTDTVMAPESDPIVKKAHAKNAPIFLFILSCVWCIFLFIFLHKKKQKND